VSFSNLTYSVGLRTGGEKKILSNLHGVFAPGKLIALMGPSGSGKTTLMDILSGRKTIGRIEGEILYEGHKNVSAESLRKNTGYVEQFDTLIGELTVRQMLMYTARLKLPSTPYASIVNIVDDVLARLALTDCQHTIIGSRLRRGISGGQAKRTNIALALIGTPSVLFLDEPTTGLDSHMANEVILFLQQLAREEGRTVVAAVHSPSAFAFGLFDELLMLNQGRVIFSGSLDEDFASVRSCFGDQGFPFPAGQGSRFSMVEWIVQITSGRTFASHRGPHPHAAQAQRASEHDFAQGFVETGQQKQLESLVKEVTDSLKLQAKDSPFEHLVKDDHTSSSENSCGVSGFLHSIRVLVAYRTSTKFRSGKFWGPRFGDKVMFSLLILSLYWGIGGKDDVQSVASTASLLYWVVAICGYSASAFVPSLIEDRPVFYRERADGLYSSTCYTLSKVLEEALACVLTSTVFTLVIFHGIALQGSLWVFALIYYLTSFCGICIALAFASAMPNTSAATAALPVYMTFCMFFGGLFLVFDKIPWGWKWFSYTTFIRYAWSSLMLNQFDSEEFLRGRQFEGKDVLTFYGMREPGTVASNLWANVGILIGINATCLFVGGLCNAYIRHVRR